VTQKTGVSLVCIDDWRLGKAITTAQRQIALAAAATVSIGANPNRVAISFSTNSSSMAIQTAILHEGTFFYNVSGAAQNAMISCVKFGRIPFGNLSIFGAAAVVTQQVGVVEYFLPTEYIQTALDSWNSQYGRFLSAFPVR